MPIKGKELSQSRGLTRARTRTFRLGLYDPLDDTQPIEFVDGVYLDNPSDRRDMREIVSEYNRMAATEPFVTRCLGVFPYD